MNIPESSYLSRRLKQKRRNIQKTQMSDATCTTLSTKARNIGETIITRINKTIVLYILYVIGGYYCGQFALFPPLL